MRTNDKWQRQQQRRIRQQRERQTESKEGRKEALKDASWKRKEEWMTEWMEEWMNERKKVLWKEEISTTTTISVTLVTSTKLQKEFPKAVGWPWQTIRAIASKIDHLQVELFTRNLKLIHKSRVNKRSLANKRTRLD